jgi:hypothetical protein
MEKVYNVNGSSRFPAPNGYSSWLEYWERYTGTKAYYCSSTDCRNSATVGAHVQKADGFDKRYYIVPLCSSCNQRTDSFYVNATLVPVPSNVTSSLYRHV